MKVSAASLIYNYESFLLVYNHNQKMLRKVTELSNCLCCSSCCKEGKEQPSVKYAQLPTSSLTEEPLNQKMLRKVAKLSNCLCCSSCCKEGKEQPSVKYSQLPTSSLTEEPLNQPKVFTFPQGIGSPPMYYPPMFNAATDKEESDVYVPTARKNLDSPHTHTIMQVVTDEPHSQIPRKSLDSPHTHMTMQVEPRSQALRSRSLDISHAKLFPRVVSRRSSEKADAALASIATKHRHPSLYFSLEYEVCHFMLTVHLQCASDLPALDPCGSSDPFVVITLSPGQETFQSKTIKKCLNPVFNERFKFRNVYPNDLGNCVLHFNLFDFDKLTRNDKMGSVAVRLDEVDLSGTPLRFDVEKKRKVSNGARARGTILLSLAYDDYYNQLNGTVVRVADVPKEDLITRSSDPYIKIRLLQHGKRWKKWRSTIKTNTQDPVFHEAFHFDLQDSIIHNCQLNVTVYDHVHVKRDDVIGQVQIGGQVTQTEARKHWEEMLSSPQAVCRWHTLLPINSPELKKEK